MLLQLLFNLPLITPFPMRSLAKYRRHSSINLGRNTLLAHLIVVYQVMWCDTPLEHCLRDRVTRSLNFACNVHPFYINFEPLLSLQKHTLSCLSPNIFKPPPHRTRIISQPLTCTSVTPLPNLPPQVIHRIPPS